MHHRLALVLAFALAGAACVPPDDGAKKPQVVDVTRKVSVAFTPAQDDVPFDPKAPRLVAATRALEALTGPLVFAIDASLLPKDGGAFDEALVASIENVTKDLEARKKADARELAWAVPRLARIEVKYTAAAGAPTARFDADADRVVLARPPGAGALIPEGLVAGAIRDRYREMLETELGGRPPDRIARADYALYFQVLTAPSRGRAAPLDADTLADHPDGERVVRLARLHELCAGAGDGALARAIAERLVADGELFRLAYLRFADAVRAAPAGSAFKRAEAAWSAWVGANLEALPPAKRLALVERLFARAGDPAPDRARYAADAYPGLDRFALGLRAAEAWIAAGPPPARAAPGSADEVRQWLVCPAARAEGGKRTFSCSDHAWYALALDGERDRQRLADAVVEHRDPALTETVFANAVAIGRPGEVVALWRAVQRDEGAWRGATRVITDEAWGMGSRDGLADEAQRLWRAHPERRGPLLRLLATLAMNGSGAVDWPRFEATFGSSVSAAELGAFLDDDPYAVSFVPAIWPALGKGWSRADVIVARLDRYLDAPARPWLPFEKPAVRLQEIAAALCAAGPAEIGRLEAYLKKRGARPSDEPRLAPAMEALKRCRGSGGRGAPPPRR